MSRNEVGVWRVDGAKPVRIELAVDHAEEQLESYIEHDPSMIGAGLMIIGRQVRTAHGGKIDLLALDETGAVHVLELKRGRTPRDITAQLLDYGSWIKVLGLRDIAQIFAKYRPATTLEKAFYVRFGHNLPQQINEICAFTVVAQSTDPATDHILRLLENIVPVKVVLFRRFDDHGASYFVRMPPAASATSVVPTTRRKPVKPNKLILSPELMSGEELIALTAVRDQVNYLLQVVHEGRAVQPKSSNPSQDRGIPLERPLHVTTEIRKHHSSDPSSFDKNVLRFWQEYSGRFAWDFLPAGFLHALYDRWAQIELPATHPFLALRQNTLAGRVKRIAMASGEWSYVRCRPRLLMTSDEPLTELVPAWKPDMSGTAIRGLRRVIAFRTHR